MGVTIAMLIIITLAGLGIYFGLKTLENFNPGRSKIQKDLKALKTELQPFIVDLVPWTEDEMEQLSLNTIRRKATKNVVKSLKGIFTTIYHEPLIAWAYRRYVSSKENALLYAKTSHHEFIYRIKKNTVEIVVDDQLVGQVNQDGVLYPNKGRKALAQINHGSEELGLPIIVNEKEVGRLNDLTNLDKINSRAFQVVSKMEDEEEKVFLALSILEMVKTQV
ncbi:MAG: hypothetical protein R2825_22100 [Saprospiraceae bacterium]|jgi:hypothetical protein